jgi:predicted nucleotidyltransferase
MKRDVAIRYACEVARRIHDVNGLLATPLCSNEAVRFKRVWVFGSVAKGSATPNDLDLLIEAEECGQRRSWRQTKIDKEYQRRYGMQMAPFARDEALKWLTRGMRKVSRHWADQEATPIDVKVLLYPRNDLFALALSPPSPPASG